jgi:hypothetical protein
VVSSSEAQAKRGERVRRESERLILPLKPGNSTRGDPGEGRRRRIAETIGRKHGRYTETGPRVNETTTVS